MVVTLTMYVFDNTAESRLMIARDHFSLETQSGTLIYCQIRKNGCSSFRRLFRRKSPFTDAHPGKGAYYMMQRHHRLWTPWHIPDGALPVFVYREPLSRIVSLYTNKFIDRDGGEPLRAHYEKVTGCDADDATLDDFVLRYVSQLGTRRLDPHLRPQRDHLVGLRYHAIPLDRLHESMSELLGQQAARVFRRKKNPSRSEKPRPSSQAEDLIRQVYASDYSLISEIEASPHTSLGARGAAANEVSRCLRR